jgi:2-keto-4-pentenoate hydratase/2-oxohepta-3-ene-1,7-dioic acid hydratase in catechol pathway
MRIVLFQTRGGVTPSPGIIVDEGIVDIGPLVGCERSPQETMSRLIGRFDELAPTISRYVETAEAISTDRVRLLPPVPRAGTLLCCIANYWEHAQRDPRPLNMFLKNPDAVIGPGDTIELPAHTEPWMFMHEAELAIVIKGPAKDVPQDAWRDAVFGYTGLIDVTARGVGRITWRPVSWMGKSFDTFAPVGPCIVTADEVPDPNDLVVRLWDNGQLRHNYTTDDMEHPVPELVAFATGVMTLRSGDLIACGTNHEGLGPIQDGDHLELEIERIGRMSVDVSDPLKRRWDPGLYLGADATHHDVVRRRPRVQDAPGAV